MTMGLFTDDKGRPELVVHPDIKLGRATSGRPTMNPSRRRHRSSVPAAS